MNLRRKEIFLIFFLNIWKELCFNNYSFYVSDYHDCELTNECNGNINKPFSNLIKGLGEISQIMSR